MAKKRHSSKKVGLHPGSVVFTGSRKVEQVTMHYLQYDAEKLIDKTLASFDNITFNDSPEEKVDWYDVRGLHDTDLIEAIGRKYKIHPLILEDIANVHQRPKFEEYANGNFITIRALSFDHASREVQREQVAIYYFKGFLVSFQESETDLFKAVRERIISDRGRIRKKGADYLCYSLIDNIVDNYFILLDQIDIEIEKLEENVIKNPHSDIKQGIHHLKKELISVRKSIVPLREAISRFAKTENAFIEESTVFFVRDLFDHVVQITDSIDSHRDILNGLQDLYLSEISLRMNQVMQVLTIITTIFVPLSFLAGLYGMNFDHIPELHYKNGYYILLGAMLIIFLFSLTYFKRKKWF